MRRLAGIDAHVRRAVLRASAYSGEAGKRFRYMPVHDYDSCRYTITIHVGRLNGRVKDLLLPAVCLGVPAQLIVDPAAVSPALTASLARGGPSLLDISVADGFGGKQSKTDDTRPTR